MSTRSSFPTFQLQEILEETAAGDQLTWDQTKNSVVSFNHSRRESCNTLGIHIRSDLSLRENINRRTEKAAKLFQVMARLGNSNGGMSPKAMRALYTGAMRPLFTFHAELWKRPGAERDLEGMKRIEYLALRKITGAYHGSSHSKLLAIEQIEPLEGKLDDISIA